MENKVGRPRKFKTVQELQNAIDYYFDSITITHKVFDTVVDEEDKDGKVIKSHKEPRLNNAREQITYDEYIERPSILGMCLHMGIHRDTLLEYEALVEYSDTVKAAKSKIEQYVEQQLYRKDQVTGIIFNLKNNFGWKDKQEIETTGETTVNNNLKIDNSVKTEDIKDMIKKLEDK
jgi:hypothetical protein